MAGLDIMEALQTSLLNNAPSQEELQGLKDSKEGALSQVRATATAPMRNSSYTPFQDMVATYLQGMVPGWNQWGLGKAVAAPVFHEQEDYAKQRQGNIDEAKLELANAQGEYKEGQAARRTALTLGGRMATSTLGHGMDYMQVRQPDGSVLLVNKKDPTQRELIPASETKQFDELVKQGIGVAKERGHENPTEWAIDNAYYILKQRPKGIAPANAVQTPSVPIVASSGKDFTPTPSPATPAVATPAAPVDAAATLEAMPGVPDGTAASGSEMSSAPQFNLDWGALPPVARDEVTRILNRADAQPNNVELQRNSTKALSDLAKRYSQARVSAVPAASGEPSSVPAGAFGVSVATGPKPLPLEGIRQKEAMGEQGKLETKDLVEEYKNLNNAATAAGTARVQLGVLRQLYNTPNMPQGEQADLIQKVRSSLNSIGVPVAPETAAADLAGAIAKKFALQARTSGGTNLLPGAMSNYEDQLLQKMAPVLSLTQEGRMALIDYMDEISQSNQRIAHEANVFASGKGNRLTPEWNQRRERVMKEEMVRMGRRYSEIMKQFGAKE